MIIAADHHIAALLHREFPDLVILQLKGYNMRYSRHKHTLAAYLALQAPRLLWRIYREHQWLQSILRTHKIQAVISDNRFGLYSKQVPCIYITHQVNIRAGNPMMEKAARAFHRYFINKFSACWIPDRSQRGLAGDLSQTNNRIPRFRYIGPLSRLKRLPPPQKIFDLLISLSGPEPQRTIFENIILKQLHAYEGNILLLRGLPANTDTLTLPCRNCKIVNHLPAPELNEALNACSLVISRSGYTTVMDLALLGKKAVLVATPGQTEQEYLAGYLEKQGYFCSAYQQDFSLEQAITKAASFNFVPTNFTGLDFIPAVNELVQSLKTGNFASQ